eukprot:TRINITY_DN32161_c0_g1_i1.p2 TRINITY_DN32161_c0_g1~~TRINITY_DN32161_c0_g1_i1.p2  ORF type:complete len:224 (-),score=73.28 TRINITY_DN32161_c0_g1_i1:72-680(-)
MKSAARVAVVSLCAAAVSAIDLKVSQPAEKFTKLDAAAVAHSIIEHSKVCFGQFAADQSGYDDCTHKFCQQQCGESNSACQGVCDGHAAPLFSKFAQLHPPVHQRALERAAILKQIDQAAGEQQAAMSELQAAQLRMRRLNERLAKKAALAEKSGNAAQGRAAMEKVKQLNRLADQIDAHISNVATFQNIEAQQAAQQIRRH